jgi:VanZ family protein
VSARRWLPPALWAAAILVLTSIPNPDVGSTGFPGADKLVHLVLYLVLGWLAIRASGDGAAGARVLSTVVAIALFAAADEWHQRWIPGRGPDLLDWGADVLGGIVGVAAARLLLSRREPVT